MPPPASATRQALRPGAVLALVVATLAAAPKTLTIDLDGDGKPDRVLLYQSRSTVTIRVRFGDAAKPSQVLHFAVGAGREDAVCRLPVELETDDSNRAGAAPGVRVVDNACDSIHIFFNHRTGRVDWWRL